MALKSRSHPALGLALFLLGFTALPWAADLTYVYNGYSGPGEIKPGTTRTIPLELTDAGSRYYCQPLSQAPDWVAKLNIPRGVAQAYYSVNSEGYSSSYPAPYVMGPSGMMEPGETRGNVLMIDIATSTAEKSAQDFKLEQFMLNPDHFRIRVRYDMNGNKNFEPEECREGTMQPGTQMQPYFALKFTFDKSGINLPDGKPMPLNLNVRMNMGMSYYMGRPGDPRAQLTLARLLSPAISYTLPLQADVGATSGAQTLRLSESLSGNRITITRYSLLEGPPSAYRPSGRGSLDLGEPMNINGHWWVINKIDRKLASITLAEPGGSFKPPSRAQVGDKMPSWTRVDLVTRSIIAPSDFKGKYLIVAFIGSSSQQNQYSGFRLIGERLKKDGDGKVVVVFVPSSMSYEDFFAQCSGNVELPFMLVLNRDIINRYGDESNSLASQFWTTESQPLTVVADPEGKIIMRESKDLSAMLGDILPLIQGAPAQK